MAFADRIAVLKDGKLQQFDTPLQVFNHPGKRVRRRVPGRAADEYFAVSVDSNRRLVVPNTDFALPITDYVQRLLGNRNVSAAWESAPGHPCQPDCSRKPASRERFRLLRIWETKPGWASGMGIADDGEHRHDESLQAGEQSQPDFRRTRISIFSIKTQVNDSRHNIQKISQTQRGNPLYR